MADKEAVRALVDRATDEAFDWTERMRAKKGAVPVTYGETLAYGAGWAAGYRAHQRELSRIQQQMRKRLKMP